MIQVVADASVLVPLVLDDGELGAIASTSLRGRRLLAPHVVRLEAMQGIRDLERRSVISSALAVDAVRHLAELPIQLRPLDGLIDRIWELRHNVTTYDAAYAALAEQVRVPLITFDARLARAPGIRCEVVVPT